MSDVPSRPRPPHVISPAEVDAWLADSVVKTVTYHRTSTVDARAIIEHGVIVSRSMIGSFGQGFYTASESDAFYGDAEVTVAIRLQGALVGDLDAVSDVVDRILHRVSPIARITPTTAARMRRELLAQGYDGIVISDAGGDGITYVIALHGHSVKVVLP